jgi:hypothetical protein
MRRHTARPFGMTIRPGRIVSLALLIVLLVMLFGRVKDPATWRILLDLKEEKSEVPSESALSEEPGDTAQNNLPEQIVAGRNDQDEQERAEVQTMLELVTDRTPLKSREMHAYWRLMQWSLTESFATLHQRAQADLPFTQLWETPDRYRAKPISLKLHLRRVLKYDASVNPLEANQVYEAWGWTDESRSFPYVVVFAELPKGLPVGTDVRCDVQFVGYFLKVMSYTAFDTPRGAPLLIGRIQPVVAESTSPTPSSSRPFIIAVCGAMAVVAVALFVGQLRSRNRGQSLKTQSRSDLPWASSIDARESGELNVETGLSPSGTHAFQVMEPAETGCVSSRGQG